MSIFIPKKNKNWRFYQKVCFLGNAEIWCFSHSVPDNSINFGPNDLIFLQTLLRENIYWHKRAIFEKLIFGRDIWRQIKGVPPEKWPKTKNRYKMRKNAKIEKSSLVSVDIRPKNFCLKFQVNRTKIAWVIRNAVFRPGEPVFDHNLPGRGATKKKNSFFSYLDLLW